MSTVTPESYVELTRRLDRALQQHAVLTAKEEDKKATRDAIAAELKKAGVDLTKPDEEIARLTKEVEDDYARQQTLIANFESELLNGVKKDATPTQAPTTEAATSKTAAADLDLA